MEDLFYLNKKEIPLNIFSSFIYNKFTTLYENVKLKIYTDNFQIIFLKDEKIVHCEWIIMKPEEFYEDTVFFDKNEITFIIMLSHHTYEINLIMPVIQAMLFEFGGMLGNDNDDFFPLYTTDNISQFRYAWD